MNAYYQLPNKTNYTITPEYTINHIRSTVMPSFSVIVIKKWKTFTFTDNILFLSDGKLVSTKANYNELVRNIY